MSTGPVGAIVDRSQSARPEIVEDPLEPSLQSYNVRPPDSRCS